MMKRRTLFMIAASISLLSAGGVSAEEVFCRYEDPSGVHYGRVDGETIHQLSAAAWDGGKETGKTVKATDVQFLHPSEPTVILGISGSYKEAWEGKTPPKTIRWFLKPPSAAGSPDDDVILPAALDELLVETELVIVIGKTVRNADVKEAGEAIFGYTVGNDIVGSATSYYENTGDTPVAVDPLLSPGLKIGDRFSPYGPYIYKGVDWNNRERTLVVENEKTGKKDVYKHNTSNFMFPPDKIVSDMSKVLTLNPGDVIFSGTTKALPAHDGDVMTVSVDGLGTIVNTVRAAK